jgi:hypothetical protein
MQNVSVETRVKTRIIEAATGKVLKESPWRKNLIMDLGLNGLAQQSGYASYPAAFTTNCYIGSGTTPTSYASGAVTFTQASTTITASANFFTSGMVGGIFKYGTGTGGAEYYITAYLSPTQVTVDTSATVAGGLVATVWMVNQTALTSYLYTNTSYETTAGSCGRTLSGNVATMKRTFNFAQQATSYNVNEIGYSAISKTALFGRIVLGATDVVPPTSFYQVILSVSFTYSPSAPTAVGNVGTNIDTTGTVMMEAWDIGTINSDGTASGNQYLDASRVARFFLATADYTQNSAISSTADLVIGSVISVATTSWAFSGARGKMTLTFNTTITTAGQTLYGLCLGDPIHATYCGFDLKLATPFTLPNGSFLPQAVFSVTYNRTLTN